MYIKEAKNMNLVNRNNRFIPFTFTYYRKRKNLFFFCAFITNNHILERRKDESIYIIWGRSKKSLSFEANENENVES